MREFSSCIPSFNRHPPEFSHGSGYDCGTNYGHGYGDGYFSEKSKWGPGFIREDKLKQEYPIELIQYWR